ncbi:MAG: hypothetical protein SV422_00215, partial [Pseudomonadota bacterium]|nr:hypothetical protein [Pseudomonadota bacterium]
TITDPDALEFAVSDLVKLPPFAARFDLIQNEESRGQVLARLGLPDAVSNLGVEELPRCDEPLLEPGTPYEQWEYGVDSNAQGPTGFVVWFAATTDPRHWRTVGKVEGYSCL